jgi:vacuolar-type H+-ATPase subunit H
MERKKPSSSMFEKHLENWSTELDRLKAKAEKQFDEAKTKYYEHIEGFRDDLAAQLKKWGKEVESFEPRRAQEVVDELRRNIQAQLGTLGQKSARPKARRAKPRPKRGS